MASWTYTAARQTLMGFALGAAAAGASAIPLTIPTTYVDAESIYTFDADTASMMENLGISVRALGNSQAVSGSAWQFMMPVTQVTLNASILPLGLTPVSGFASGSGLMIQNEAGALTLANFGLDFKRNVLTADLGTSAGVTKAFDVYSFTVDKGLHVSASGGLSMAMNLSHMTLTSGAQAQFASALQLDELAVYLLPVLNFGTLDVNISPALRFGLSDKPLVAAIPEPPRFATLGLGLLGLAFVARRRLS